MEVVFIDPAFGENAFNTFGKSHWSSVIQHGLCLMSACAKEKGFTDIGLIDMRALSGWSEFKKVLSEKENPSVFGIPMRSCDVNVISKLASFIKDVHPDSYIVVGGVHPTVATEETAVNPLYDYVITGEGEISFVKLLEDIRDGNPPGEKIIHGIRPDLDKLPYADRELYDYKTSISLPNYPGVFKSPMVTMVASRGCMYRCNFCAPHSEKMFGKGVRFRGVGHVIGELKQLYERYHFRSIKFYDYTFTLNNKWVLEFCEKFKESGIKADFLIQSRADLLCMNKEIVPKLKEIGLKLALFGFESGSQKVLDSLDKGTTVEQNLEAARICKENGVMVGGSFMLGTPWETIEDAKLTLELVKKMKPHFTSVSFFTPIPGNYLYDHCIENNLSLIRSPEELTDFSPGKPKIKGVDYEALKPIVEEIMGVKFGGKVSGKFIRLIYVSTKNMLWLRQSLIYLYSRWVGSRIYRAFSRWL
jgi:anaerobic magnesium-protoporphyrin IX monomethyl ester cyclase